MKKLLLVSLILTQCAVALAEPLPPIQVKGMVAQIEDVMSRGLCSVAADTKDYGSLTMTVLLPSPVGPRKILINDYNWMRSAGYERTADGRFEMSRRAEIACNEDAVSGKCLAFRSFWRTDFPASKPAGSGVTILSM